MNIDNLPLGIQLLIFSRDYLTPRDLVQLATVNRNVSRAAVHVINQRRLFIQFDRNDLRNEMEVLIRVAFRGHRYQAIHFRGVNQRSEVSPFRSRHYARILFTLCPNVRRITFSRIDPFFVLNTLSFLPLPCPNLRFIEIDFATCRTSRAVLSAYFGACYRHRDTIDTIIRPVNRPEVEMIRFGPDRELLLPILFFFEMDQRGVNWREQL